ncbi:MAG: nucleotidyltransferase family protein, partial [Mariprofundaceae bacterium]|nr:nucleotidyltransferase family protein [Mariprofundaceae bacterium]
HHHAEALVDFLGDGSHLGVRLYFSWEDGLLDSGGGVRTALECLPGDGPFVVHNADVLADIDIRRLSGLCPEAGCAIALVANPPHHPDGDFALQGSRVLSRGSAQRTFAGVSVWYEDALAAYPAGSPFSLVEPMRALIAEGCCAGWMHRGQWFDIGRPVDLFRARRMWRTI